jgi:hypothetical protein
MKSGTGIAASTHLFECVSGSVVVSIDLEETGISEQGQRSYTYKLSLACNRTHYRSLV